MKRKELMECDSALEELRIQFTELTQDQFVVACGIPRATYYRWIAGKTKPNPSMEQIVHLCRVCKLSPKVFFSKLGLDVSGIPDDKPSPR